MWQIDDDNNDDDDNDLNYLTFPIRSSLATDLQ